jgi:hypothetical protein
MQDPKFEQEVQRRMHDLEFVPSESVWAGIQQGIAPRQRRRAAAILWWLFPGALLLAGGIVMYRHSASTSGVAAVVPAAGNGKSSGGVGKGIAGSGVPGTDAAGVRNGIGETGAGKGSAGSGAGGVGIGVTGGTRGTGGEQVVTGAIEDAAFAGGQEGPMVARRVSLERYQPGLIGGMTFRRGVTAPPPGLQPVNPAVSGIRRSRHPWAAGFAAGGGVSSIHSGSGNALVSVPSSYNGYGNSLAAGNPNPLTSAISSNNGAAGGYKQNKFDVQLDYSYWAGIYGEKQLSARWSVDIGLNLHYYSFRLETNNPVNVFAPSSASLFASTTLTYTANSANAYSAEGLQTYYNRYYFLEAPVTVQWRVNRSRTLPLFWRGGAVFSYLMSSNGLYYDNSSGTYEKDNGVVRRTQASVNSGLMVGLPIRGVQIQAGPEVQYTMSSLLTTGSGGGHMVYSGVRVALMR